MLGGVCSALAHRWQVDPTIVRIAMVLLSLIGGLGVALYVGAVLLVPREGSTQLPLNRLAPFTHTWSPAATIGAVVGLGALITVLIGSWLPFGIAPAVGLGFLWYFGFYRRHRLQPPAGSRPPEAAQSPAPLPKRPVEPMTDFERAGRRMAAAGRPGAPRPGRRRPHPGDAPVARGAPQPDRAPGRSAAGRVPGHTGRYPPPPGEPDPPGRRGRPREPRSAQPPPLSECHRPAALPRAGPRTPAPRAAMDAAAGPHPPDASPLVVAVGAVSGRRRAGHPRRAVGRHRGAGSPRGLRRNGARRAGRRPVDRGLRGPSARVAAAVGDRWPGHGADAAADTPGGAGRRRHVQLPDAGTVAHLTKPRRG
ncbi:PspC domain-containing protein [Micropruina sp.]|uniref:PspC domain-containing protein n=1 Tax=Micropruina sp. TaxID=2737536 RepID=UPI0039E3D12B